ncbi:hypothetical protein ACVITL_005863 [Rhizobium pisi]
MLADNAFQAEPSDMLKQDGWFCVECFRQPDGIVFSVQRVMEEMPARSVFDTAQIVSVEIDEIESVEDGVAVASLFAGCAERCCNSPNPDDPPHRGTTASPSMIIVAGPSPRAASAIAGKLVRPVMTDAGENPYPLRLDVNSEAIAIPFQLPAPFVSCRRLGLQ